MSKGMSLLLDFQAGTLTQGDRVLAEGLEWPLPENFSQQLPPVPSLAIRLGNKQCLHLQVRLRNARVASLEPFVRLEIARQTPFSVDQVIHQHVVHKGEGDSAEIHIWVSPLRVVQPLLDELSGFEVALFSPDDHLLLNTAEQSQGSAWLQVRHWIAAGVLMMSTGLALLWGHQTNQDLAAALANAQETLQQVTPQSLPEPVRLAEVVDD